MLASIGPGLVLIGAMGAGTSAFAADWQPVGSGTKKIEVDRSRISSSVTAAGAAQVTVWSRLNTAQVVMDTEGGYNSIEALNRYDCPANRFTTLKRLYLVDNTLVRAEKVLAPREIDATPGSIDAAILADVCKPRSKTPATAALPMQTDVAAPKMIAVSDKGHLAGASSETSVAMPIAPRRLIDLPKIDPAQIQHPTDASGLSTPPAQTLETAKKQQQKRPPRAIASEAAKAGVPLRQRTATPPPTPIKLASAARAARKTAKSAAEGVSAKEDDALQAALRHKNIHWAYAGDGAPENWAALRADYAQCGSGQRQSPIDIREGIGVDLEPIKFDYKLSQFRIIDNGHTVQVSFGEGNSITVTGHTYRLVQLHFHRPSEERVNGRSFDMVMHMVHQDASGRLAVVAVLIEHGNDEQPVIQTFWNNLPLETDIDLAPAVAIDPAKLLPDSHAYYTYMGSLTTPPCTEGVLWMVFKQPLQLSAEQIAIFSRLYSNNARPIQPSNGRVVKEDR